MYLKSLFLQNFRIYKEAFFEFSPQINLICGENARGKTTILEAIYVLICGRSFRTPQLSDLIRTDAKSFLLEAVFEKYGIEQTLRFYYDGAEKQIIHNQTRCKTSTLLGLILGVIMTPEDINLIKGAPSLRRQFLDLQIAQKDPLYSHEYARYAKAMRQRNTLLRIKQLDTIETWELEMAKSAAYLTKQRSQTIHILKDLSLKNFSTLGKSENNFILTYKNGIAEFHNDVTFLTEHFTKQFRKNRLREIILASTLSGPHKDDLKLSFGEQEIKYFASEGQQRTCVSAMRFSEWQHLAVASGQFPLFLIDDVGISLDLIRKQKFFNYLNQFNQVFLTSTEKIKANKIIEI